MAIGSPIDTHFALCALERKLNQTLQTSISFTRNLSINSNNNKNKMSSSSLHHQEQQLEEGALHHSHSTHDHHEGSVHSSISPLSNTNNNNSNNNEEEEEEEIPNVWSFADTNKTRLLSRDLSPHATDEVFNSVSHLSAAMLSLLGMVLLISQSGSNAWKIVSFSIYGGSLIFLFICSTLHHAVNGTPLVRDMMNYG